MPPVEIRPMQPRDLDAVSALAQQDGAAEVWTASDYLALDTLLAADPASGRILGFAATRTVVPGEEHEVLNIFVAPDQRAQGIGSKLLKTHMGAKAGIWFLEVRESNQSAIRVYKALGFNDFGRRKGYYQNPYEDAIVMRFCS